MKRIFLIATAVLLLVGLLSSHSFAQPFDLDFGDAPEGAPAYPPTGVVGAFPTCINVPIAPWIQHTNFGAFFGFLVDFEPEGNGGICPSFSPYDNDECFNDGDAGLIVPSAYTIVLPPSVVPCPNVMQPNALGLTCQTAIWGGNIDILVQNFMPGGTVGYVNVLMDWDQNGVWGGVSTCPPTGTPAPEHILVNFPVPNPFPLSPLSPPGLLSTLGPPPFLIGPNAGYVWTRFSITELPVPLGWDGSGSFEDGESEDYLLRIDPDMQPTMLPQVTECPVEPTRCPVIDTQCPLEPVETHCPVEATVCPVISTQCPVQPQQTVCPEVATQCPVVETECPTQQTLCPLVETHCPEQQTLCPKIPEICPPQEFTIWPIMQTMCPLVFTVCPQGPTLCPAPPTTCPADPTWCPIVPTECPVEPIFTVCPLNATQCPVTATECPLDYTYCPEIPTVCPIGPDVTTCPEVATLCPEIPTECSQGSPTQCPIDPTFCPELLTECPIEPTQCPVEETSCPTGATWCPTNPTNCPQVTTECPVASTQCPVNETTCPTGATWCPVNPTYCPVLDSDGDGVIDCYDNCPTVPNGPLLGTCVKSQGSFPYVVIVGVGKSLTSCNIDTECVPNPPNYCLLSQSDTYPPSGNGCGDACECYADINGDSKVDLTDLVTMKGEFLKPCPPSACNADLNDDNKVDLTDLTILKLQYLRTGCPC